MHKPTSNGDAIAEQLTLDGSAARVLLDDGTQLRWSDEAAPSRSSEPTSATEVVVAEQLNFEGRVGRLLVHRHGLLRWRTVRDSNAR